MPAATASIADVSRGDASKKDERNKSGQPQAQCSPMPLPALGTQKIIQGNGTNVGTIISLQCPAKHRLVGSELKCVLAINNTQWEGETYCKPLSRFEDYGFRVAVLASIVSLGIIFIMSVAFITSCLLDCIKEDERKKQESRDSDGLQGEEQVRHPEGNGSRYSHKGRNNNNNTTTQEGTLPLLDTHSPAVRDNVSACRCHQEYESGPACTNRSTSSFAALPGQDYEQPLLTRNQECAPICGPPLYPGHPLFTCQTPRSSLIQTSLMGPDMHQYGEPQRHFPSRTDGSDTRNIRKDFSIRIISV